MSNRHRAATKANNLLANNELHRALNVLLKHESNSGSHIESELTRLKAEVIALRTNVEKNSSEYDVQTERLKRKIEIVITEFLHEDDSTESNANRNTDIGERGPDNFWDVLWRILQNWKLFLMVLGAILLVYFIVRATGPNRDLLCLVFDDCQPRIVPVDSSTWAVRKAAEARASYAILHLIQHIKIEDDSSTQITTRKVQYRNYYTIKALRNIQSDHNTFLEHFTSSLGPQVITVWAGNERQKVYSTNDHQFYVDFEARQGDVITLVTGVEYNYQNPFDRRVREVACFEAINLTEKDWMACYPNSSDWIQKMTIIVESANFPITFSSDAAVRKKVDNSLSVDDATCRSYRSESCTVVANWYMLQPTECVAIKVQWL